MGMSVCSVSTLYNQDSVYGGVKKRDDVDEKGGAGKSRSSGVSVSNIV